LIGPGKFLRIDSKVEFRTVPASAGLRHLGIERLDDGRQTFDHSGHRLAGIGDDQHHQSARNPFGHANVRVGGGPAIVGRAGDESQRLLGGGRRGADAQLLLVQRDRWRQHAEGTVGNRTRRELQHVFGARPVLLAKLGRIAPGGRRPLNKNLVDPFDQDLELPPDRPLIPHLERQRHARVGRHDRGHWVSPRRRGRGLGIERQLRPQVLQQIVAQIQSELAANRVLECLNTLFTPGVRGLDECDELIVGPGQIDREDGKRRMARGERWKRSKIKRWLVEESENSPPGGDRRSNIGWSKKARTPRRGDGATTRTRVISASSWKPHWSSIRLTPSTPAFAAFSGTGGRAARSTNP